MKISYAHILVVDDDVTMRTYAVNSLRRLGIQLIETCTDGVSALHLLNSFKPDLVLTDIHMEPMGGLELVQKIREHPDASVRNTKVIFMSSDARITTLQDTLPLGAMGYIIKPLRTDTLLAKLENALGCSSRPIAECS
ncbi:MAG: response regulator [Rhodoferax sp.]|uniref:response regulator n=1 Tax=Rhodoferax sp. TaxID=50421 RepID=UPI0030194771